MKQFFLCILSALLCNGVINAQENDTPAVIIVDGVPFQATKVINAVPSVEGDNNIEQTMSAMLFLFSPEEISQVEIIESQNLHFPSYCAPITYFVVITNNGCGYKRLNYFLDLRAEDPR